MKSIKIGTRNSPLALWQAREVARELQNKNFKTDIIPISSAGDKNLQQPLYAMGIHGVFTKDLDIALLNGQIDIAVHSLKDIPTELPEGIDIIAQLKRDYPEDILIRNSSNKNIPHQDLKVGTSSLRRKAFWLKQYPNALVADIRGNIQTRLQKLEDGEFDAIILSRAAIDRLHIPVDYEILDMMIQAPAQGVIAVCGLAKSAEINEVVREMNDNETEICTIIERNFLNTLEGGCTAPIGAKAEYQNDKIRLVAEICSLDGKNSIETDEIFEYDPSVNQGRKYAEEVLAHGGKALMEEIKSQM